MKKAVWIVVIILVVTFGVVFWRAQSSSASSKELVTQIFHEAGIEIGGGQPWDIVVHNDDFYSIVVAQGSLGLGETYMAGMWDCPAIDQFIYRLLISNADEKGQHFSLKKAWWVLKAKLFNLQNRSKSLKVINQHYNLGNELYEKMLGPSMAYSCGYWRNATTLTGAQEAKYDLVCRKLELKPGMHVVDIGCGFGGFAKYAAKHYGVHVVGVTLSTNQASYAKKLCQGFPVEILVQDYRDLQGKFDRVVSIGMFEHVGPKNYRDFMEVAFRSLKENGMMLLHTIGGNVTTNTGDPWIQKYIFPGGVIPSIAQVGHAAEELFVMEDWHNFGLDYNKTLMAWHANFDANWPLLKSQYNQTFYRMWNYYLLSCAAVFRARECQLWQIVFSKNRLAPQYRSIR